MKALASLFLLISLTFFSSLLSSSSEDVSPHSQAKHKRDFTSSSQFSPCQEHKLFRARANQFSCSIKCSCSHLQPCVFTRHYGGYRCCFSAPRIYRYPKQRDNVTAAPATSGSRVTITLRRSPLCSVSFSVYTARDRTIQYRPNNGIPCPSRLI